MRRTIPHLGSHPASSHFARCDPGGSRVSRPALLLDSRSDFDQDGDIEEVLAEAHVGDRQPNPLCPGGIPPAGLTRPEDAGGARTLLLAAQWAEAQVAIDEAAGDAGKAVVVGAIAVVAALAYGASVFAPLALALFIIALVWPMQKRVQSVMPRSLALILSSLVIITVFIALAWLTTWAAGRPSPKAESTTEP